MDRGSRFFYALEKMRGAKKHVTCLLAEDGTPLTDPVEMCGRARDFYTSLFSPDLTDPGACRVLWEELPTTYTVPGRSIFDNLFLVRDLLELGHKDGLSFALLSLDQERAFDRVDHGYLLGTLQAFGFGPQFVSFLQVLYSSAECLVRLNWTLTEPVSFGRGVRQGCPLSGQLYALAIEPFLCLLQRRLTWLVLQEPELRLVLSAYADDVLLVVQDPGDLARVEACQAIYSAASSARVNCQQLYNRAEMLETSPMPVMPIAKPRVFHEEEERRVKANDPEHNEKFQYANNRIKTSKYNILTFLPVNLFEQFQRVANAYFLSLLILQLIPEISSLSWFTTIVPLMMVFTITAVKDATDDCFRHKSDNQVNNRQAEVLIDGRLQNEKWMNVRPGDVIKLENNTFVAADVLLLSSSEPHGLCYIETAELDGETNLKVRQALPDTSELGADIRRLAEFDVLQFLVLSENDKYRVASE
ncbi:unnamed protein product [Caretta caretta]